MSGKVKEIEINMVISGSEHLDADKVCDLFVHWVEAHGWTCGGGVRELTQEDYDRIDREGGLD